MGAAASGPPARPASAASCHAALGAARCAIVAFEAQSVAGVPSEALHEALAAQRIAVSLSGPKHTFDQAQWAQPAVVRVSPSYYNTQDEVDRVVDVVREAVARIGRVRS